MSAMFLLNIIAENSVWSIHLRSSTTTGLHRFFLLTVISQRWFHLNSRLQIQMKTMVSGFQNVFIVTRNLVCKFPYFEKYTEITNISRPKAAILRLFQCCKRGGSLLGFCIPCISLAIRTKRENVVHFFN